MLITVGGLHREGEWNGAHEAPCLCRRTVAVMMERRQKILIIWLLFDRQITAV